MNNNRGMALVVALLTSFILLALVASLFWVIASTSRQVEYAKNSAIALNLAEAGTADAIYRLNYCTNSTDLYPFAGSLNPFGPSASLLVDLSTDHDILTSTLFPNLVTGTDSGIKGTFAENGGAYYVGIQDNTYPDTLVSVGIYKGIRRILTVSLRGNNNGGIGNTAYPRQAASGLPAGITQGISEAFNKHVIYADTVTAGTTVTGNIAYTNTCTSTTGTKTFIAPTLFRVPVPGAPPDLPTYLGDQDVYQESAAGVVELNPGALPLPPGVTYNNVTDTFTFGAGYVRTNRIYVKASAEGSPPNNGHTIINGATIQNFLKADGTITVQGSPIFSGTDTVLNPLNGIITITPGVIITGNLIVAGAPLTLNNVRVNGGGVISNGNIIFSGTSSTINASTATDTAAILVNTSGAVTITINVSPSINLGSTQNAAVYCYSTGGTVGINVNANLTPTYNNDSQAAIITYSTIGNATIDIGTSSTPQLNGLVYAGSGGNIAQTATITLTNGTIIGSLVAGGTASSDPISRAVGIINLSGGILTYNKTIFTNTTNLGGDIFSGFSGGRRAYVPVWRGWRLR